MFSLRSDTNVCISSLRSLIIFTIVFWNSLFNRSSFMQMSGSLVVNWLLMESDCLAVSLRFTHLELFLVKVLIPCVFVIGVVSFFSWSSSSVLQRRVCWICYPLLGSCAANYLFSLFSKGAGVPIFDACGGTLMQSQWGVLGLCALWEGRSPSGSRIAIATQWRSWDSSSWTGETWLFCKELQCETLGFCVLWGNRFSGATHKAPGYSFPLLSKESGILALWCGSMGSLAVRDSGECSMLCGEESFLVPAE
jgi:hypothetical protein